jgi:hypothetical protein
VEAGRDCKVDHDLDGLPQMEDHGVGGVRRGREAAGVRWKALPDTGEVSLHGGDLFREDIPVEGAQRESSARTSS